MSSLCYLGVWTFPASWQRQVSPFPRHPRCSASPPLPHLSLDVTTELIVVAAIVFQSVDNIWPGSELSESESALSVSCPRLCPCSCCLRLRLSSELAPVGRGGAASCQIDAWVFKYRHSLTVTRGGPSVCSKRIITLNVCIAAKFCLKLRRHVL